MVEGWCSSHVNNCMILLLYCICVKDHGEGILLAVRTEHQDFQVCTTSLVSPGKLNKTPNVLLPPVSAGRKCQSFHALVGSLKTWKVFPQRPFL